MVSRCVFCSLINLQNKILCDLDWHGNMATYLPKCVLGMTLWVSPGRQRQGEHTLREKRPKRPQRWNRRRRMADITTAGKVEGCSRNGPPVILVSIPLDPYRDLSRTVWWLYVHQSLHVKQSYTQALLP